MVRSEDLTALRLVFQNADVKPTTPAMEAMKKLQAIKAEMEKKRDELK